MIDHKAIAITAAKTAGALLKEYFEQGIEPEQKSERLDLVSKADRDAEDAILAILRKETPDYAIVAEESGVFDGDSEYTWVIDPLDGTSNFLFGIDFFCVSIALRDSVGELVGVVYDPIRDQLFVAERGAGAFCNGVQLAVSREEDLLKDITYLSAGWGRISRELVGRLLTQQEFPIRRKRDGGAAALHFAYIAQGKNGAGVNYGPYDWDTAAGKLLIEEAGGKMTVRDIPNGKPHQQMCVAANKVVHDKLLQVVDSILEEIT